MARLNSRHITALNTLLASLIGNLEQDYQLQVYPAQIESIITRLLPYIRPDYIPTDYSPSALRDINKLFLAPEQMALGDADKPTMICLVRFFITSYILKQQSNYLRLAGMDLSQAQSRLELEQELRQYQQRYGRILQQTLPWDLQQQVPCLRSWLDETLAQAPPPLREAPIDNPAPTASLMNENTRRTYNRINLFGGISSFIFFVIMGLYLGLSTLIRQNNTIREETGLIIVDGLAAIAAIAAGLVNLAAGNNLRPFVVGIASAQVSFIELIVCVSLAAAGGINNTWLLLVAASFATTRLLLLAPGVIDHGVGYFRSRRAINQEDLARIDADITSAEPSPPMIAAPAASQDPTQYTRLFSPEPTETNQLLYPTFALPEDARQPQPDDNQQNFFDASEDKREYQPPV
jgi:hypothetical protein